MGYTHYYYVESDYERETFRKIVADFEKLIPILEHIGVKLAGPFGDMKPIINEECIAFNGLEKCGHTERDLGITWPSKESKGVANLSMQHRFGNDTTMDTNGSWGWGANLNTRTCDGDCSHETFRLERYSQRDEESKTKSDTWKHSSDNKTYRTNPIQVGKFFECTKTAYKPYDLAVNVCLIIAKHYLENHIAISSDGEIKDWKDGMEICQHFLGYGENFKLDEPEEVVREPPKMPTFEERQARIKEMDEREAIRKALRSQPVKVGDIFEHSWGYDQTNIDYYKVIEITKTGKSAKVVKIGQMIVKQTGFMSETVIPDPEKVIGDKIQTLRIKQYKSDGTVYIGNYWRWDNTPSMQTHYA